MSEKVAAVVVTYNRKQLLLQNIRCLLGQKKCRTDILIIDNNSTDGTFEALSSYITRPEIQYYNTGSNLGGAGGFSYGIRLAVEKGYDYLWIMDDDCMPASDALACFLKASGDLKGDYGFLSGKILWRDGNLCKTNVQRHPLTKNITEFDRPYIPATLASFVSLFIKSSVVLDVGLPIREFFVWTDDWEYTRRISLKYPCYVVPASTAVHMTAANEGIDISSDTDGRIDRYWYLYRNDVYLYRREGIRGIAYEAVRLTGHILRVLLRAPNQRIRRLKMILKGTAAGLRFHPQIEYISDENT